MDVALVERCLQCLRHCGVIALVEAIQVRRSQHTCARTRV